MHLSRKKDSGESIGEADVCSLGQRRRHVGIHTFCGACVETVVVCLAAGLRENSFEMKHHQRCDDSAVFAWFAHFFVLFAFASSKYCTSVRMTVSFSPPVP